MSHPFDDKIRKQLEAQESPVPTGMFEAISNHPDVKDALFDGGIRQKLNSTSAPVAAGLFDKINEAADLENLPFDTGISSKLANHSSPVPAGMWQRIMEQPARRRPIAWWWMAAAVLLLLGGGIFVALPYFGWQHNRASNATKPPVNSSANDKVTLSQQSSTDNSGDDIPVRETVQQQAKNGAAEATAQAQAQSQPTIRHNQSIQDSAAAGIFSQKRPKQNTQAHTNKLPFASAVNNRFYPKKSKPFNDKVLQINGENNIDNGADSPETNAVESATARLTFLEIVRNNAKLSPGHLLKAKPRAPVIPCPVNGSQSRNDWYVDAYASALMLNKRIQTVGGFNGKNAEAGFDSTLHRQVSFNAGISLVKNIGENFLIKTGIQYTRINEAFRLTQINERKLVTTISVRTVVISPGDTVVIRDTSVAEHIGTIQRGRQNTYTQWDVPVILGYEFGGSNIRINANAGIIANIRTSYSGNVLDTLQQVQDINLVNGQPLYRTRIGISLYAGFSLLKPLTERASLLIEPHVRIGLGNTATDNAWFTQKNRLMGISIGIRYKLNGGRQRYY